MQEYIKSLSQRTEFIIVLLFAFGYFILVSFIDVFSSDIPSPISNTDLQFLVVYELIILIVLILFLLTRNWKIGDFGFQISLINTLIGVGLAFVAYTIYVVIWTITSLLSPDIVKAVQDSELVASDLSIATIILVSIVNPVFEELFVSAYIIKSIKPNRNFWMAINISILIRLLYHLYQGVSGIISILPLGFIFAYWYARTGKLWPLVIAHAIFDFIGLYMYTV